MVGEAKPDGAQAPPVVAAFDIGSNTIKMTVGRRDGQGGIEILDVATETVRLGTGVERTGRLAEDRVAAALAALGAMSERARDAEASRLVGVATEATRAAANGPDFLRQVEVETGIEVRAIGGDEEADLTFRGLAATIDISGRLVIADIGGGSTELIAAEAEQVRFARSFRLGSGALTDRLVNHDPPVEEEFLACRDAAREVIESADLPFAAGANALRLIAVGGTGEFLARLLPDGGPVTESGVLAVLERLKRSPAAEVAAVLGIPEARARVLPAGISIVRALVEVLRPASIEVSQSGIRIGLLLKTLDELEATTTKEG